MEIRYSAAKEASMLFFSRVFLVSFVTIENMKLVLNKKGHGFGPFEMQSEPKIKASTAGASGTMKERVELMKFKKVMFSPILP